MAKRKFGIAVDIGTTTIEAALIRENGDILRTSLRPNTGARFGADVMSRIRAASEGHGEELSALLRSDITEAIRKLLTDAKALIASADTSEADTGEADATRLTADEAACAVIVLAGNTAMLHKSRSDKDRRLAKSFLQAHL